MGDYEVRWLTGPDQIRQAVGVTARALRDDPTSLAVSDDPLVRLELMYSTFDDMLAGGMVAGVLRGDCVLGAAGATPPGDCVATLLPPEARALGEPGPGANDVDRFHHMGSVLAEHDLPETHWHVGPVGVEPGFQGMGIGGAALQLLCREFDDHQRLAWLETARPRNVRFYMSQGFEVVEEITLLSTPNWFMRRDPR
jgi:ribosomal protein S18 acetylase RimI-like enzyme